MIFHQPDTTKCRLNSCLKRAQRFAKQGNIDKSHPLYTQYANFLWYVDGQESLDVDEIVQTMIGLDWFALKVENYSKSNMLDGDETLAAMLYEWQKRMPFGLPKKKNDARTSRVS